MTVLIQANHPSIFLKTEPLSELEYEEFLDELKETSITTLNKIVDEKNLVIPQFSVKVKRQRAIGDSAGVLYEQLIFSNDFEPAIKSVVFDSYAEHKDILIRKPFIFGNYLTYDSSFSLSNNCPTCLLA